MLRIEPWKIVLILLVCAWGIVTALPNVLAPAARAKLPAWLGEKTINLGLDLRGGSYLLLEVGVDEARKDTMQSLAQSLRGELRTAKIRTSGIKIDSEGLLLKLADAKDMEAAEKLLRQADPMLDVVRSAETQLRAAYSEAGRKQYADKVIGQSIEIVRRRVDESGTKEPSITRQGENRIVVQLPGVSDPAYIKSLLGRTAKLGFHVVDEEASLKQQAGINALLLPLKEKTGVAAGKLAVERVPDITGDMLTDAQSNFRDGMPVVSFRFNGIGAKRFCDVSTKIVGKPFAIVLDGEILSAPNIREPICGGSGEISGNFTVQEASDLALLLRAGALPAPLDVVEERTIGASLGEDSVAAGKKALIFALVFVSIYILLVYGLFGAFAVVGLLVNCVLMAALLSILGATLTLPGIAGIVLTIGMAVDANVLIYERIREEHRNGKSLIAALESGYKGATNTIVDSNVTTLIAAFLLFALGSGPVKGFAVTLTIGIVTSMFAAIYVTRLMVVWWARKTNPKTLPI